MKSFLRTLRWTLIGVFVFITLLPLFGRLIFLDLPGQSDAFDCDDAALFMYDRFTELGIKAAPIVGNLTTTGEKYDDITHIWLLVNIAGFDIPFDWGSPWFDSQHREGYVVSYEQLAMFVEQDRVQSSLPANPAGPPGQ